MIGWEDGVFLVIRWIHIISAVVWIGGSAVMALVIKPVLGANPEARTTFSNVGKRYSDLASVMIMSLTLSGVLLTLERIYLQSTPPLWFIILGLKLVLAAWIMYLVWHNRKFNWVKPGQGHTTLSALHRRLSSLLGYNALIVVGLVIFFLSSFLQILVDSNS